MAIAHDEGNGSLSAVDAEIRADPAFVLELLKRRNLAFAKGVAHQGDVSATVRTRTADEGQTPLAVVVTCSDSRVAPEHLFNAGIGELFVIRTAGNVIGPFELGSIEYAVDHLATPIVVVLGHTHCGAVDAALSGEAHGAVAAIVDEIAAALPANADARDAERRNVANSIERIRESDLLCAAETAGALTMVGAIYDIASGEVGFL